MKDIFSDLKSLKPTPPTKEVEKNCGSIYNPRLSVIKYSTAGQKDIDIELKLLPFCGSSEDAIYKPQHNLCRKVKLNGKDITKNSYTTCNSVRDEPCPICDHTGVNLPIIHNFLVNVLILKDTQHPELEGKIMLYQCDVDISEFIYNAKDENPFDGKNGKILKINIASSPARPYHTNTMSWIEPIKIDDLDTILDACSDYETAVVQYVHTLDKIRTSFHFYCMDKNIQENV